MNPFTTLQYIFVWNPFCSVKACPISPPPPTELRSDRATCCEQRLTLEGLQEQLVVGLDELQVGLLGCSHRGGARLVQAVGFCTSRTHTGGVASTRGGAGSVRSHPERPGRLSHLVRGLVCFKNKEWKARKKKSPPLPLSKQKSGFCSRLGGAPAPA